jgi:hypothetical protein
MNQQDNIEFILSSDLLIVNMVERTACSSATLTDSLNFPTSFFNEPRRHEEREGKKEENSVINICLNLIYF